jgi:hypothetical protein
VHPSDSAVLESTRVENRIDLGRPPWRPRRKRERGGIGVKVGGRRREESLERVMGKDWGEGDGPRSDARLDGSPQEGRGRRRCRREPASVRPLGGPFRGEENAFQIVTHRRQDRNAADLQQAGGSPKPGEVDRAGRKEEGRAGLRGLPDAPPGESPHRRIPRSAVRRPALRRENGEDGGVLPSRPRGGRNPMDRRSLMTPVAKPLERGAPGAFFSIPGDREGTGDRRSPRGAAGSGRSGDPTWIHPAGAGPSDPVPRPPSWPGAIR